MSEKVFNGIELVDGTASGFSESQLDSQKVSFIRTEDDKSDGYLRIDGKNYGTGKNLKRTCVVCDESQTLTEVEKNNVRSQLGIGDETVKITLLCDDPSAILGTLITITYKGVTQTLTWSGSTVSAVVPIFYDYTISFSSVAGYYKPFDVTFRARANNVRNVNVSYDAALYTDLSMVDINGNLLEGGRETANSYVIHSTGYYQIPLIYGAAYQKGVAAAAAYTQAESVYTQPFFNYLNEQITDPFIETDTDMDAVSAEVVYNDSNSFVIENFQLVNENNYKFVRFEVTSVPPLGGNSTIVIKDESGTVMWSWHLWYYPDSLTTKRHINSNNYAYDFLDVNLGWVKSAAGSKYGYSPYYQWGRKDPMLRYPGAVGHGSFSITSCAQSLAATIQNPNVFNTYETTNYNWWTSGGTAVNFFNYWDADIVSTGYSDKTTNKTVYDPCPVQFSIPCGNAYVGFSTSNGGTWDYGYTWDDRFFYAAGYRYSSSGGISDVGSYGYYWSSAAGSTAYAYYLSFGSGTVYPRGGSYRAFGFSVAPVASPGLLPDYTDLSLRSLNGDSRVLRETANCYVLQNAGKYEFPFVYGCSISGGTVNTDCFTRPTMSTGNTQDFLNVDDAQITDFRINEDLGREPATAEIVCDDSSNFTFSGLSIVTKTVSVGGRSYPMRYVRFECLTIPSLGANATLAVKDSNGDIMWSWHIWGYPYRTSNVTVGNGYSMLDVNLGWVKSAAGSEIGYCPYYQWGRKDPMLRYGASDTTGNFAIASCATSLGQTIKNPFVFNTYETTNYNWWTSGGTAVNFFNYWDAKTYSTGIKSKVDVKTVYDPCPVGYTVPCGFEWTNFTITTAMTWNQGYTWDNRRFQAAGYRSSSSGGIGNVGIYGSYWSSAAISSALAYSLRFHSGYVVPRDYYYRAYGWSVAPVASAANS